MNTKNALAVVSALLFMSFLFALFYSYEEKKKLKEKIESLNNEKQMLTAEADRWRDGVIELSQK